MEPPKGVLVANRVMTRLARYPVPIGPVALLTVPGRRSGVPRTAPIAVMPHGDGWTVITPFGVVDWVKNLRAAGGGTLMRRGRRIEVVASELPAEQAGPVIRATLRATNPFTRRVIGGHFAASTDDPDEVWVAEAAEHPVILLRPR